MISRCIKMRYSFKNAFDTLIPLFMERLKTGFQLLLIIKRNSRMGEQTGRDLFLATRPFAPPHARISLKHNGPELSNFFYLALVSLFGMHWCI